MFTIIFNDGSYQELPYAKTFKDAKAEMFLRFTKAEAKEKVSLHEISPLQNSHPLFHNAIPRRHLAGHQQYIEPHPQSYYQLL